MNQQSLILFSRSLLYRFADPQGRDRNDPTPLEELKAQARAIDAARCQRLVFSGGSPLTHPDFLPLVEYCRSLGLKNFALETDGKVLAAPGKVQWLADLGFTEISIVCGAIREKVYDFLMNDPGTFRQAMEGIRQAALGQPRLYIIAPVVRPNVEDLEPLFQWVLKVGGKLAGFLLAPPELDRVAQPARKLVLSYSKLAEVSANLFRVCQGNRVEYGFATKRGLPPCAADGVLDRFGTVFHERFNYFRHAKNEQLTRVSACQDCSLNASCEGIEQTYVKTFGTDELKAVPLDVSMNWKLRRFNTLEEFEFRNVSPFKNEASVDQMGLLRINGHCNMSCAFCFVDRTAPDFDTEDLRAEISRMAEAGLRHLVLSGGEPTLHPNLPELIAHARSVGFTTIEMQSNGVYLSDLEYTRKLVEAGLSEACISLHSADPKHSDEITRLPNAFWKTIQGMHNLRQLGVFMKVAHVITKANYKELPETVRFLRKTFTKETGYFTICFAIAQGISDLVFQWVIPTYTEIKPYFTDALNFCLENGIGFGGMIGQGGYPPCMLDGDMRYYEKVLDQIYKSDDSGDQFYKAPRCVECEFNDYCVGPRRAYVEHYGDAEIAPFKLTPEIKERLATLNPLPKSSTEPAQLAVPTATRRTSLPIINRSASGLRA